MKCHTHITSIKRIPRLKGQIHVSKRWGRTALQLQKFSISVVNTDFLIFPHEFSNIAIHLSALQAILWYLQHLCSIWHLSQHFTGEKTHWWMPSFHCLQMFNFRYLILNFQNVFRTVQLRLAFPAAEHTPFLHICLMGLTLFRNFWSNLLSITTVIQRLNGGGHSFSSALSSPQHVPRLLQMLTPRLNFFHDRNQTKSQCPPPLGRQQYSKSEDNIIISILRITSAQENWINVENTTLNYLLFLASDGLLYNHKAL